MADNIAITVYRPLIFWILAGKYKPGEPIPQDSRGNDSRISRWLEKYGAGITRFNQFAVDRNLHPAQLAVAWLRHSPAVTTPIIGVSSARQLEASFPAFDVTLSDAEYAEVTGMFDTAVKEEAGGAFAPLRRDLDLVAKQKQRNAKAQRSKGAGKNVGQRLHAKNSVNHQFVTLQALTYINIFFAPLR